MKSCYRKSDRITELFLKKNNSEKRWFYTAGWLGIFTNGSNINMLFVFFVAILHIVSHKETNAVKQQVMLSDSYLPVAMQIIAHLTDQMSYEAKEEPPKTTARAPQKPLFDSYTTSKPSSYVFSPFNSFFNFGKGWLMGYYASSIEETTPHHSPGLYAPVAPPKPGERVHKDHYLLPVDQHQHTVIAPPEKKTEEPLLDIENTEFKPLVDPQPIKEQLLPPLETKSLRNDDEDLDNLQYLSPDIREMVLLARSKDDDRLVDVLGDIRAGEANSKIKKVSATNLRLTLLYDLLSREAKRLKLSDYSGFSDAVMRDLVESSNQGARAQLKMALAKMVERKDCGHDYANNRAKEMVIELGKDESVMSHEIRYLQPLVYKW